MTDAWWYEKGGQPAGPVPFATLRQLAASGDVKPATLVWAEGMPAWARAESVAHLAFPSAPPPLSATPPPLDTTEVAPPPPSAGAPPPAASGPGPARKEPAPSAPMNWLPQPRPATAAGAVAEPDFLNVASALLLSVVTFGIYGAIQFFQTVRAYERLSGRETRFQLYFWIFVGSIAAGAVLHFLLPLTAVAALVFEFLALAEALRARREAMARWQLTPAVASENTHWLYLGLGTLLAPLLVGLVFLLLQAKKWFEDWNAIRSAAIARG